MSITTNRDLLRRFQLSFFAMCRLHTFPWKCLETELQNSQSDVIVDVLKKTCLHSVCRKTPPSLNYRRLFLSELIKTHESTGSEPLDELYAALGEVVCAAEESVCYKTYFLPSGQPISLEENVAMISEGTTGLVTWEAALYLAEWAMENTHLFTGKTVLELGSGSGLSGVAVCHACKPHTYVFTDCHQSVLQRLRKNIQSNGLSAEGGAGVSVRVEELDWAEVRDEELRRIGAETVVAADVVYDPEIVGCLVGLLAKLAKVGNKTSPEVYISSTVRNPATYRRFKGELEKVGLRHAPVSNPVTQVFPYDRVSSIEIIRVHAAD